MMTTLALKRKNIDLPPEALQKLSLMAVANGKSLKAYIESVLISKANSISIEVSENPSPSGDEWFCKSENIDEVEAGILEHKERKTKLYSMDDIRKVLEV